MRAEAGVGASIASGNQTWAKNWAALIVPERHRNIEKIVKTWNPVEPKKIKWKDRKGVRVKITERSVVVKIKREDIKDKNINISLIRENTKVFKAAFIV